MPAYICDQLGPFVGLLEANFSRRMPTKGDDELEAWRKMIGQPLENLLSFLSRRGLLESQCMAEGETYLAVQEALPCLTAIWRYVDPSSTRSGFEDALRRAVNRFQRTRPAFSFGGSSASPTQSRPSAHMPCLPGLEMPKNWIETVSPPSSGSEG